MTPPVLEALRLTPDEYRPHGLLQPITGFRTGCIGYPTVDTDYGAPVSFGIRRAEFDHFLLQRSGAELRLGVPVTSVRFDGDRWILDERIAARYLVGAGGHFCPVARHLGARARHERPVAALEIEVRLNDDQRAALPVGPERPELYFTADLRGYGWCFLKGAWLNVGFGYLGQDVAGRARRFREFLRQAARLPEPSRARWHGHAYLLSDGSPRTLTASRALLVGDAAGLAHPQSGEGIRAAVESGLLAASTILAADGRDTCEPLRHYEAQLRKGSLTRSRRRSLGSLLPAPARARLAIRGLQSAWLTRQMLARNFLRLSEPALDARLGRTRQRPAGIPPRTARPEKPRAGAPR